MLYAYEYVKAINNDNYWPIYWQILDDFSEFCQKEYAYFTQDIFGEITTRNANVFLTQDGMTLFYFYKYFLNNMFIRNYR